MVKQIIEASGKEKKNAGKSSMYPDRFSYGMHNPRPTGPHLPQSCRVLAEIDFIVPKPFFPLSDEPYHPYKPSGGET